MQYYLELQKKRLEKKALSLEYDFLPRGHFAEGGGPVISWGDDKYYSRTECRTCKLTRRVFKDDKKIYDKGQNELFYATITSAYNGTAVENDLYTCPNCGAISKVKELQDGCPYCQTYFKMSDLFPKVTNYFFVRDVGGTEKEIKGEIKQYVMPCVIAAILLYLLIFYISYGNIFLALIPGILGGLIFGGIVGYVIWAVKTLGGLFKDAGKSIGVLVNTAGSKGRFVELMKQHSPEFCYEYFSGKVLAILKMMIYADDVTKLPNYAGKPVGKKFNDIVEASGFGTAALKKCEVRNDRVYVTVDVYMDNLYETAGRIRKKHEKIRMDLYKKIDKSVDYHFSIKQLECKTCGTSFDATKENVCPSCKNRYDIEDDEWIVTRVMFF